MNSTKLFIHGSYIGTTGYNNHTRSWVRPLSKLYDIKIRNFTVGKTWSGLSTEPHNNEPYLNDIDKKVLYSQILWTSDNNREDFKIYESDSKDFTHDLNIVLCETNHHLFYDEYVGPKIAYNVWESTLQPSHFFERLKHFDELWVPSEWQKSCTIKQGYPEEKIKVLPEGVDTDVFFPENVEHELTSDGRFKFFIAGRWDYRKSTKELIESFLNTFEEDEPVDLIISVDNPYSNDGLNSTEERLSHYNMKDDRIKIVHFPKRDDYIKLIKSCNVFLSCARSEGWNLPLIESMSCGIPSIYSNCSGQLEFAKGLGIPVKILGEKPVSDSDYNHFNVDVGNYYEPDFSDLIRKMRMVYENYESFKTKSLLESVQIRERFSWDNIANLTSDLISDFMSRKPWLSNVSKNEIKITYNGGPKVEILGQENKEYYIEFIDSDTNEVIHYSTISNNMWTSCSRKYFTNWIIKVNGEVHDVFNVKSKTVRIVLDSSSLGDTIAWSPYAVEFQKKYGCNVILSTYHNQWFIDNENYSDISFSHPLEVNDVYATFMIGWFRDSNGGWDNPNLNPNQVNLIPLQQTATDILGLDFSEVNHGISLPISEKPIDGDYIVIAPQATSGCKEWVYSNWVELSNYLTDLGYKVVSLTSKPYFIPNVINIFGEPWETVATYLHHSKFLIGLGSGISWFNWSLGKFTYMINGFAKDGHEFTSNVKRITNNTCIKCWNDEVHVFDSGDWNWCPVYKGTKLQHICQKSITPSQVIKNLDL